MPGWGSHLSRPAGAASSDWAAVSHGPGPRCRIHPEAPCGTRCPPPSPSPTSQVVGGSIAHAQPTVKAKVRSKVACSHAHFLVD